MAKILTPSKKQLSKEEKRLKTKAWQPAAKKIKKMYTGKPREFYPSTFQIGGTMPVEVDAMNFFRKRKWKEVQLRGE